MTISICFIFLNACSGGHKQEFQLHQLNQPEFINEEHLEDQVNKVDPIYQEEVVEGLQLDNPELQYFRFIVIYRGSIDDVIQDAAGVIINEAENIRMATAYLPLEEINKIKQHQNVMSVEVDQVVEIKQQKTTWGYEKILVPRSLQSGLTGKGIKIAIIDTGISPHNDLSISGGASFVGYTDSYSDDNGHGTHVAGIIGAKNNTIGILGVAPNSDIYALKSLDYDGEGFLSDIISAIDWSITNKIDVINLSLGMQSHSLALKMAVDKAYNNNILIVGAGGNEGNTEGSGDTVFYPARYDSVIAVAATDELNQRAPFSATGPAIEISAPGSAIFSTYLDNKYVNMSGTSMATPFVTGTLALLKQANPTLPATQLRQLLQKTLVDLGNTGKDDWFGYGFVQSPPAFSDINNHWAYADIITVSNLGWIRGIEASKFAPNQALTRAQAAAILVRALGLEKLNHTPSVFTDINGHWAQTDIEIISQHRIIRGMTETTFSPNTPITREQMATILTRILELERSPSMTNPFIDVQENHWAANDIITSAHYQIFRGISSNLFGVGNVVSRAQMAALMNRISEQIK